MNKTVLSLFITISIVSVAYSEPNMPAKQSTPAKQTVPVVPIDDTQALQFYEHCQIILPMVNPQDLAGCLIFEKGSEQQQFLNILSDEEKKNYKPTNLSSTPYSAMLTEETAAKVDFLLQPLGITFGPSSANKQLLQVNITDVWKLEAPSFVSILDNKSTKEKVLKYGGLYRKMGYNIKYCNFVKYSLLTTSVFESTNKEISASFIYVDLTGKKYRQITASMQKELISTAIFDINPILDELNTNVKSTTTNISYGGNLTPSVSRKSLALTEADVWQSDFH